MRSIELQRNQTAVNLISGIAAMAVNLAVNFFLSPYIVRTLGEEANGLTQLANNFVTYASLLTLAFSSMAGRFMSVSYHRGQAREMGQYYSSVVLCNILLCGVLAPCAFYIVKNLERIIVIENADVRDAQILFACVFLNFLFNMALSVFGQALYVKNALYLQNLLQFLRYLLNAVILLVVFSHFSPRVFYVSATAMGLTCATLPVLWKFQRKLLPELRFRCSDFSVSAVREMLASGIWNTVNQCGNMLMTGMDLLLCNLFISPAAMGLLSVAKTIPNAIVSLAATLNSNFAPALTIDWAHGDKNKILRQLRSSMRISSVILSICIVTFCAYAAPFYRLWMPMLDAKQLSLLSFLTCMAYIPWAGPQTLYNVFTVTNHLKVNSLAFVGSGVFNIIIVYFCLKYTGLGVIAVAGVSSSLSILRNLLLTAPYTAHLLDLKWNTFYPDVGVSLAACGVAFAASYGVQRLLQPASWPRMVLSVAAACIIALGLDLLLILNRQERKMLFDRVRRRRHEGRE